MLVVYKFICVLVALLILDSVNLYIDFIRRKVQITRCCYFIVACLKLNEVLGRE